MTGRYKYGLWTGAAVGAVLATSATAQAAQPIKVNIPAQNLQSALDSFVHQSRQQLLYDRRLLIGKVSPGVRGTVTPEDGLSKLLAGTSLTWVRSGGGVFMLKRFQAAQVQRMAAPAPTDAVPEPAPVSDAAAEPASEAPLDIIVTARRRAEDVSKVPLAVTAFSAEQLEARNVASIADLTKITPGLNISGGGSRVNPFITIRGQSRGVTGTAAPGVLTYFNDVPLATAGSLIQAYDMDNVQVLKGPQGTLFGRNSIGGAVLTYSKRPTHGFGGYAKVEIGNFDFRQLEGAINFPVVQDVIALRVAGQVYHDGGFTQTFRYTSYSIVNGSYVPGTLVPGGRNLDEYDGQSFRGSLLIEPGAGIKSVTVVDYSKVRGTNGTRSPHFLSDPAGTVTPTGLLAQSSIYTSNAPNIVNLFRCGTSFVCDYRLFQEMQASNGDHIGFTNGDPDLALTRIFGVNNTTSVELGSAATLKNIFSYRTAAVNTTTDNDGTPFIMSGPAQQIRLKAITEELQLAGSLFHDQLKYTVGGFYYKSSPNGLGGFGALDLFSTFGNSASSSTTYLTDTSKALYGQIDYSLDKLVSGLTLTAGYRHSWDESSACIATILYTATSVSAGVVPNAQGPIPSQAQCIAGTLPISQFPGATAPGTAQQYSAKFNKGTYALGANWQISQGAMVYITKRRGYRAGGFNTSVFDPFLAGVSLYQPEVLDDIEIGTKLRWQGSVSGSLDIALFRGVDKGIQFQEPTTGLANVNTVALVPEAGRKIAITAPSTVVNKGDVVIDGFEFAATISPVEGLSLGGGVSYTRWRTNKFTLDPNLAAVLVANGKAPSSIIILNQQPKWTSTANITYDFPGLVLGGRLTASADFKYSDKFLQANFYVHAYHTVDARIALRDIGGTGLDVALFSRNLLDEHYDYGSASGTGFLSAIPAAPRTFGVSVRYNFRGQ